MTRNNISTSKRATAGLMEGPRVFTIAYQNASTPINDTKWGNPCRIGWEKVESSARDNKVINRIGGTRNNFKEDMKYNQKHNSLIKTIHNSIT